MAGRGVLLCFVLASVVLSVRSQIAPVDPTSPYFCIPVEMVAFCTDIGYSNVSLPNLRNHVNLVDIANVLQSFEPLVRLECSNAIVHFLCSFFAPLCDVLHQEIRVRPCDYLCEYVRAPCAMQLEQFGFEWPDYLDCSIFPSREEDRTCFGPPEDELDTLQIPAHLLDPNITIPPFITTAPSTTPMTTPVPTTNNTMEPQCPRALQVGPTLVNKSYTFNGIKNCGMPCSRSVYFSDSQQDSVAPVIILLLAVVCVLFTLFTVATFLIDRRRFHYPERPIIFLSFCYLIIAIAYIIGTVSKLANGSFACSDHSGEEPFVFQRLPSADTSYRSASCAILFVLVYFFHMASAIWWVILTLTWFLAAAMKWGEEAVEKLWLLYHVIAWSIPAIQVILVLALQLVDGDQLAGLCYTGNASIVALGVFVFTPLMIYLLTGLTFFAVGFTALLNIRRQVQKDPNKTGKITRLIIRVAVYSTLYALPNFGLLFIYIYELAQRGDWEMYQVECTELPCSSTVSMPSFPAFLLKYIFLFLIGICSSSWVISQKTFNAWHKFFCSCGCQQKAYNLSTKPISPMQVKPPGPHPHQTAV